MKILRAITLFTLLSIIFPQILDAKTVEYDLTISQEPVSFTGSIVEAMTINGSIPGPTLEFSEGDTALIRVHNRMDVETSIHWHGLLLPNREDGVPYLTTLPIMPDTTYTYSFPLKHAGTYWYHSHTGLQEQRGVYGSIVIRPQQEIIEADREYVLVLSDWTDEDPHEVLRTLKRGSEYYSLKKGAVQSLLGSLQAGAIGDTLHRSWIRMPPMDITDVAYDQFLINGQQEHNLPANPGEKVRLRIINAGASSYFYLQSAAGPLKVVAADGLNVSPVSLDRFLIAIAETYDVLVTIPEDGGAFEFRATAQDGSGMTSLFIGSGERHLAADIPKPNLYKMDHGSMGGEMKMPVVVPTGSDKKHDKDGSMAMPGHTEVGSMTGMNMERPLAPYAHLKSPKPTSLDTSKELREITLTLTGDMERYVWSFDDKILTEADVITIRRGENVRIAFDNKTMMHHPIHLHGHFFRVVNKHGEYSPLKHTVDIPPLGKQVIEFYANEEKDWFLHCHILYHMKVGMARVVHYEGSTVDPDILAARRLPNNFLKSDPWYAWGEASFLSQMTSGALEAVNSRNSLALKWEYDWNDYEHTVDLLYGYWFNRFLTVFGGIQLEEENSGMGVFGLQYLLPFLFDGELRLDTDGDWQFGLDKELQLTSRLHLHGEAEYDTDSQWEWQASLGYTISKRFVLQGTYHSEFKGGGGLKIYF